MRMVWTLTAVGFMIIQVMQSKFTDVIIDEKSLQPHQKWFLLGFTCLEFFVLGMLECIMKIINCQVILRKMRKSNHKLPRIWKKLSVFSYQASLFVYSARNFSMSLYFGFLCVFAQQENNDNQPMSSYTGVILVLQVYLAMIRGRFYGFFMHGFLSIYFVEDDHPMFSKIRSETEEDKEYFEEEQLLCEKEKHGGLLTKRKTSLRLNQGSALST